MDNSWDKAVTDLASRATLRAKLLDEKISEALLVVPLRATAGALFLAMCTIMLHEQLLLVFVLWVWLSRKAIANWKMGGGSVLFLTLCLAALAVSNPGTLPIDDAIRHAVSYLHDYDYAIRYPLIGDLPHPSMWIGYEVVSGWLNRIFGLIPGLRIQQFLILCVAVWVCWRAAQTATENGSEIFLIVVCMLFSGIMPRVQLARPEVLMGIWAISAIFLTPTTWTIAGLFLMPSYWLAFIYLPTVLMLRAPLKTRILCGILLMAWFIAFWVGYGGSGWWYMVNTLQKYIDRRAIEITESGNYLAFLLDNSAILVMLIYAASRGLRKEGLWWPGVLVIAYFMAPSQVRYLGVFGPLIIITAAKSTNPASISENTSSPIAGGNIELSKIIALTFSFCMLALFAVQPNTYPYPSFTKLDDNARTITTMNAVAYYLGATHMKMELYPPMEIGMMPKDMQYISLALSGSHELSCETLWKYHFQQVIEEALHKTPSCLTFVEANGKWRLWRVKELPKQ